MTGQEQHDQQHTHGQRQEEEGDCGRYNARAVVSNECQVRATKEDEDVQYSPPRAMIARAPNGNKTSQRTA
jgi:hypothetical protein